DALNGCLCRQVLDSSLNGVLECKQAGCETQWYHLQCVELELEPRNWVCIEASGRGCGGKHLGSANDDEVILLYIEAFLIM
ncbi:hypothetical protein L208DRAFT_1319003, partial [Tricholoma matsutake]